ncbi:hypothetical protein LTR27_008519 [Elasticomyces elasticus]|nr:hypothetical protein LTR27_008519 [Elasticomyces elasticus]
MPYSSLKESRLFVMDRWINPSSQQISPPLTQGDHPQARTGPIDLPSTQNKNKATDYAMANSGLSGLRELARTAQDFKIEFADLKKGTQELTAGTQALASSVKMLNEQAQIFAREQEEFTRRLQRLYELVVQD